MKEKILELRKLGKNYNQIVSELGCSKSLVCYYLGKDQKNKNLHRQKINRKKNPLLTKIHTFLNIKEKIKKPRKININLIQKIIYIRIYTFFNRGNKMSKIPVQDLVKEFMIKIGDNPKCYLTGDSIDLSKPKTYQLDHIIPTSKNGQNTLDNLGLTTKEANLAKRDLSVDEFINLCKKVLQNNGYKVEKI